MTQPERHGYTNTPLYNVWLSMRARCSRPSDTNFKNYGAKGISVCAEWSRSFTAFHSWATGNGYGDGMSIERLDFKGNYCPENCTFIPRGMQNRNTSWNRLLAAWGETKCIADWADDPRCAVTQHLLQTRVTRLGWDHQPAIETPKMKKGSGPKKMKVA